MIGGTAQARSTAYSADASSPQTSAARSVPCCRVRIVSARVSMPVTPRSPWSRKYRPIGSFASGTAATSRVTQASAFTSFDWKFFSSTP